MDLVPYRHEQELRALLGGGTWLLDLGGGTGRVSERVRDQWARVVVADVERNMLKRARRRGLDTVVADARHLPFRECTFGGVLTVDAFHHFPGQDRVLAEVARSLAPSGRAVLEEFDPSNWQGRLIMLGERLARFGSTFHRPADLERMVRTAGLAPRVERLSSRDYAVVAERD